MGHNGSCLQNRAMADYTDSLIQFLHNQAVIKSSFTLSCYTGEVPHDLLAQQKSRGICVFGGRCEIKGYNPSPFIQNHFSNVFVVHKTRVPFLSCNGRRNVDSIMGNHHYYAFTSL